MAAPGDGLPVSPPALAPAPRPLAQPLVLTTRPLAPVAGVRVRGFTLGAAPSGGWLKRWPAASGHASAVGGRRVSAAAEASKNELSCLAIMCLVAVGSGASSTLGRPEASSWGRGRLPSCSGRAVRGVGAAGAFGWSREAEGAPSSGRAGATANRLMGACCLGSAPAPRACGLGAATDPPLRREPRRVPRPRRASELRRGRSGALGGASVQPSDGPGRQTGRGPLRPPRPGARAAFTQLPGSSITSIGR